MRLKSKILAGAAAAALAAPLAGLAVSATANAATPSCGKTCIDVFSQTFGSYFNPQFALDVYKRGQNVGQPIILFRESDADPAQDFTVADEGTVADFKAAGLMSDAIWLHYGGGACTVTTVPCPAGDTFPNEYAFEDEYAPYGADTGLCVGVASTAAANEKITLQPCGVSSKTVWVVDYNFDGCAFTNPLYALEAPLINGSDTNFSHPFVAEYPGSSYPTDTPRPQLFLANLTGFSQSGNGGPCGKGSISGPDTDQLWSAVAGVLP